VKNTVNGDGTFAFTSNFGLTTLATSGGTGSQTIGSLLPGSGYSVSETVPSGWAQTGVSCSNGTPAAITVAAGATTTCTFTNTNTAGFPTGSIRVVKNTVNGDGTFAFTSNFGLTSLATSGGTGSQTIAGLLPGSGYSVSETVPSGWVQTFASCTNGTLAAITVVAGATTTCTITNTQQGSIRVVKNTVGGDGTFTFTSNFGLTSLATSGGTASQTFSSLRPGGGYGMSEIVPSGWTQTSASCTNGSPGAITVVAGATTTCIITNTRGIPPSLGLITVVKNTVGGNGTFAFASNFGLTSLTTSGGTASLTFGNLTPGSGYSISETAPSGWVQTSASCTSGTPSAITVTAGATTICTFTNTQLGSIRVVKNTVGGDGTFAIASNFGLTSLTTSGGTGSLTITRLAPGSGYSVSETIPAGWTQSSASCTNGTPAAITVAAGATTTCTFTNTQQSGSIRVVKNTVGGDGTFAITSNFGLTALSTSGGTASLTITNLAAGSGYRVSETVPAGWTQTSANCTNGTPAAITVAAGATTTCTFTNTQLGAIQVVKNAVGGDGTFAFTSNFGLTFLPTSGGTGSLTIPGLAVGSSYSLSERVPPGWTQTGASCTNGTPAAITVAAGATTTCTITNTKMAVAAPDLIIGKSHAGNFRQGDTADAYTLTVTNAGQGPTTGAVTVSDTLPAGLTATAIGGTGWSCTLTPLTCTRADTLVSGAAYPVITVTVNVAVDPLAFNQAAGSPAFQAGDILISMTDGTVEWRRRDWTLVKVLAGGTGGQAKGLAFDSSGNLYVTHWIGSGSSGNDVMTFDRNGNATGYFGSGYDCNPSSIVFDNSGNAYVGQADCNTQIFKFDSLGDPLAQYDVAVENRGSYHIVLDPNQCTMYYTSEGPDVKRFNVCNNTQMADFNSAPLPDPVGGAQQFSLLPGGGMLVADFNTIARLDASGKLVRTYDAPANNCWLGMALDQDGTSFWASNWCGSSVTRFDLATGNVMESHVVSDLGFMVKQLAIPGNIFSTTVTNTATVAGGGELNTGNDSASDATTINPPAPPPAANNSAGIVNAASYAPTVAAGSSNQPATGMAAQASPLSGTIATPTVTIGGVVAQVSSSGLAPGAVGLYQVNVRVPAGSTAGGAVPVILSIGGVTSNTVTIAVQ
jgi:sugar lactone lactonase YvrE